MELINYLKDYGYWNEDALEISKVYHSYGFQGVKEFMKDWDDKEHDYTYEVIKVIEKWRLTENVSNNGEKL